MRDGSEKLYLTRPLSGQLVHRRGDHWCSRILSLVITGLTGLTGADPILFYPNLAGPAY